MGQTCSNHRGMCTYYVFANATPGSVQDKQNKLVNYVIGAYTQQDIINQAAVAGQLEWYLYFPLIYPPAIPQIYSMHNDVPYNPGTGLLDSSQYEVIDNPWYQHAQLLEAAILGAGSLGEQYSLPCVKTYNVPFGLTLVSGLQVTWTTIPNVASSQGGGYNACWNIMSGLLTTPQEKGGQMLCVGDPALPQILNYTSYSQSYTNLLTAPWNSKIVAYLNNPTTALPGLFPPNTPFGPYDLSTQQPCQHIQDPTCSYQKCKSAISTPTGYACQTGGKCNPTYGPGPSPPFRTQQECEDCQTTGNCGINTCCSASQPPGKDSSACPTNPPLPTPSGYTTELVIGAVVLTAIILALVLFTRYGNKYVFGSS